MSALFLAGCFASTGDIAPIKLPNATVERTATGISFLVNFFLFNNVVSP
jgi:hypothetical protein